MNNAGRIGFVLRGDYSSLETYDFLDVVYFDNSSYVAKKLTIGNSPEENSEYWQILVKRDIEKDTYLKISDMGSVYKTKKKYTINLSSYSTDNFYLVTFSNIPYEIDCEIYSPGASGSAAYNYNTLHFLLTYNGWNDIPLKFNVLNHAAYDTSEITIASVVAGNHSGGNGIYLRGGLTYTIYSNIPVTLRTSQYTLGDQVFPSGTATCYKTGFTNVSLLMDFTTADNAKKFSRFSSELRANSFVGSLTGNASTATKLETARRVNGVLFDGSSNISNYATCSTAAATAAKVVDKSGFELVAGARITIRFTITNTAANPTLNVNGTGAKAIQYRGAAIATSYLAANRTYDFVYDGTYYQLVGDINTNTTYTAASATPKANGTAAVGTSEKYAREDHVHPLQTSVSGSSGSCTGNAATATKATQDGEGNVITDTYVKILEGHNVVVGGTSNEMRKTIQNGAFLNNAIVGGINNIIECSSGAPRFYNAIIGGDHNKISGGYNNTIIGGCYAEGASYQLVTGHQNDTTKATEGTSSGTGTGTAFCIGNGTGSAKSNAARIDYNGKLWCKAAYSATGADYAELFEWIDSNPDNEDRRGYFVTMDGDKIKKASSNDWILGIVSANPCVLGNTDMEWNGQFLKDEFGAFLTEEFTEKQKRIRIEQITNENGEPEDVEVEYEEEVTGTRYVLNPDYDPEQQYIDRISRPEWDAIGMMGVLSVYDDGSCQVNGFCSCNDDGIATTSETGYRVIQRVDNNIVKVVFK